VVTAARSDLMAGSREPARIDWLLSTIDMLLARASIEDTFSNRRAAASERISKLAATGLVLPDVRDRDGASLFASVTSALESEIGSQQDRRWDADGVKQLVQLLVATDIPDARTVRGEGDGRGDPSTNSLGEVAVATLGIEDAQLVVERRFGPGIRVTDVVRLAGGFSKETILVSTTGSTAVGDIVLRKVVPGRPTDHLPFEYEMVRFAWSNGLPVPEPLWIQLEPDEVCSPYFVTRRANGANAGDVFGPYPGVGASVALDIAGILAHLHRLDASGVGTTPTVPMYETAQVLEAITQQDDLLAGLATADDLYGPLWKVVLAWLRANVPERAERPVLVHADVGFHNLLVSDDRVEALLDWERSHLGSVSQDLAYVRPSIESLVSWADFLAAYEAAGGTAPPPESLQFYSVWQDTWRGIASLRLRTRFVTDPVHLSDSIAGILMQPRFLLTALQSALSIDLGSPEFDEAS